MWRAQLSGLSDIATVVAVDLRGRGKSPAEAGRWSIDDHADDLAETLRALGADRADVAGFSMGGYVVLALQRRYPQLVRRLVLIDTRATADGPRIREGRARTAALIGQEGVAALLPKVLPRLVAPGAAEDLRRSVETMFRDTPASTGIADTLAMSERPDSTSGLAAIEAPVLVANGEWDATISVDQAKQMAAEIPDAVFVVVPGAGHLTPMENPAAINEALRAFLKAPPGTAAERRD